MLVGVAALAWILGAGSLLLFGIFLWTGSLGVVELQLPQRYLIAIDASLCVAFFLQHSIFIRHSIRSSLQKFIPEYSYGTAYTIASGGTLLLLVLLWQRSPLIFYELSGSSRIAARGVLILAFAGFFWGIRSLKRFDAFGTDALQAHLRGKQSVTPELTIVGPYRLVRHPFYAFGIVACWATPLLSLDRFLFNALFTSWIWLGATLEERDLLRVFGEDYAHYQKIVPMFVPRLWARQPELQKTKGAAGRHVA